jgi:hypothetical protein
MVTIATQRRQAECYGVTSSEEGEADLEPDILHAL